jgi:hypothetical protein
MIVHGLGVLMRMGMMVWLLLLLRLTLPVRVTMSNHALMIRRLLKRMLLVV